jgi:adenine-specific DNA methylase
MIEKNFDIQFIADLALREKQIQQEYRPIIAVHKWFARRPGTLFRGLLLAEFLEAPIRESFYHANCLGGKRIADPFMGGGTPLLEANRLGCDVVGFDINPMAYWIVKQEIEYLDLDAYIEAAYSLRKTIEDEVGSLYRTTCVYCGATNAHVKYFLWVKYINCIRCQSHIDLFPGYLLADNSRHPKNVFVCPSCGHLTEVFDRHQPGDCQHCHTGLSLNGPAKRNHCICNNCGTINDFPNAKLGPPPHRIFALEYHCPSCKEKHVGRYFKTPDALDISRIQQSEENLAKSQLSFVPDDRIPSGDETNRLHRWGYIRYRDMFNSRQLVALELSARLISEIKVERIRNALATNLSDLLRYQNMLCRYDTMALKSLDIFSVHGFPVGLIQCESNLLGILDPTKNACIGSGGWANIIEKFRKAKAYCDNPFEIKHVGRIKQVVPISGEWIGDHPKAQGVDEKRIVDIRCEDASTVILTPASIDAVFTDPPYYGNVQYAELMDFCYVWLRRLIGISIPAFKKESTRNPGELTGNDDMGRGLDHFANGLSSVFLRMAEALKPGSPLAFTYHHNDIMAYIPIAVAVLDAGLRCSASLPCPAEMGASIHINGTGSSIIDTIFVCRSKGLVPKKWLVASISEIARLVLADLGKLKAANVKCSHGDTRCIAYGHLIRLAIWSLHGEWDAHEAIAKRMGKVYDWIQDLGGWPEVEKLVLASKNSLINEGPIFALNETGNRYGESRDYVSF